MNVLSAITNEAIHWGKHAFYNVSPALNDFMEKTSNESATERSPTLYFLVSGLWERKGVFAGCPIPDGSIVIDCNTKQDMRKTAEEVKKIIKSYFRGRRLKAVGRSQGGLVLRYAIQCLGADEYINFLGTIGTPHQGTDVAEIYKIAEYIKIPKIIFDYTSIKQMATGSEFLQELNSSSIGKLEKAVNVYTGNFDELIHPHENGIWKPLNKSEESKIINRQIPVDGHAAILYSPEAWKIIREFVM